MSSLAWVFLGHVLKLGARDATATRGPVEVCPTSTDLAQVLDRGNDLGQSVTWTHLQILRAGSHHDLRHFLINLTLKNDWAARDLRDRVSRLPGHDYGSNPRANPSPGRLP